MYNFRINGVYNLKRQVSLSTYHNIKRSCTYMYTYLLYILPPFQNIRRFRFPINNFNKIYIKKY